MYCIEDVVLDRCILALLLQMHSASYTLFAELTAWVSYDTREREIIIIQEVVNTYVSQWFSFLNAKMKTECARP